MLKVMHLTKTFGPQTLFEDAQFHIHDHERIGLVGRNGHGKSTLFRILIGQEEADEGEIDIPKHYTLGYLQQHLEFTQSTLLAEACHGLPPERAEETWQVEKILFGLGFSAADLDRPPQEFSGGFQIRLNLAKVLAQDPDLLLLDEPTNYLDIVSVRWLRQFLIQWKKELILITHDRGFMDSVVTHVMGIHRQKIRKLKGDTDKYYQQIMQDEEIYEQTRLNDEKKRQEAERFITRFRAKARLAGLVQSRIKALEKMGKREQLSKIENLDFDFTVDPNPIQNVMEAQELSFAYSADGPRLIDNLDLTISQNDRIAVIGPNGRGKSTLLRLLAGELDPSAGRIKRHPRLRQGYYGQTHIARLTPDNTILEELAQADPAALPQRVRNIAGTMMFQGDDALKPIRILSGGERSRVLLGKLLLQPSHLLLLDEPTHHLDMDSCETLTGAIANYEGAVVMVTHDESLLRDVAERLIVFDQGRVFNYNGTYDQFLKDIGWQDEQLTTTLNSAKAAGKPGMRKDLKQARAKILKEKSQELKPLEQRIRSLELQIEQLESNISQNDNELLTAANTGNKEQLANLPRENRLLAQRRDTLYQTLEPLIRDYDQQAAEYQKKIDALESNG